jgi:SOS-response transcriptional repressor LexA
MPPTLDEICTHFGFSSPNAAREHLRLIQKKGYLERAARFAASRPENRGRRWKKSRRFYLCLARNSAAGGSLYFASAAKA